MQIKAEDVISSCKHFQYIFFHYISEFRVSIDAKSERVSESEWVGGDISPSPMLIHKLEITLSICPHTGSWPWL